MKTANIMEALVSAITDKIFEEWKHEGGIYGWSSEYINFEIDGKEYMVAIREVEEGKEWCQYKMIVED